MTDLAAKLAELTSKWRRTPSLPAADAAADDLAMFLDDNLSTILQALRASRPEPITGGPEIKLIEMEDWSQGYAQDAPPVWRVELGDCCVDFEHERAARNWADAIVRYGTRPEPAADALRAAAETLAKKAEWARSKSGMHPAERDGWLALAGQLHAVSAWLSALPAPPPGEEEVERAAVVKWLIDRGADLQGEVRGIGICCGHTLVAAAEKIERGEHRAALAAAQETGR